MSERAMPGAAAEWHPTSVRLSPDDLAAIAAVVVRTGYSRNEVMRILLRIGLRLEEIAPKDRRAALEVRPLPETDASAAA
jgi:hypothetical protein